MLLENYSGKYPEAGCDEAGRGCLAGPVVAAAVILPQNFYHPDLNDSKKLSEKKRNELRIIIEENALAYSVVFVDQKEVDQINVLNASIAGIQRAVRSLRIKPEYIIVDGNRFKDFDNYLYSTIVKGDAKYLSIAAASILAKTYRDDFMIKIDQEYPQFEWAKNKGYPTQQHRSSIAKYGSCKYHRKSFNLLGQLKIEFK